MALPSFKMQNRTIFPLKPRPLAAGTLLASVPLDTSTPFIMKREVRGLLRKNNCCKAPDGKKAPARSKG